MVTFDSPPVAPPPALSVPSSANTVSPEGPNTCDSISSVPSLARGRSTLSSQPHSPQSGMHRVSAHNKDSSCPFREDAACTARPVASLQVPFPALQANPRQDVLLGPSKILQFTLSGDARVSDTGPGGWDSDGSFFPAFPASGSAPDENGPASVVLSNRSYVAVSFANLPQSVQSISVAANALTSLDMDPLQHTPQLTALILNSNCLKALDLSSLAKCPLLERLWLHNNSLTTLDLNPLSRCRALRSLYLDSNRIDEQTIDLSPLVECKLLRALRLGKNALGGMLDITPILSCSALATLDVAASVRLTARVDSAANVSAGYAAAPPALPPALRRRAATVHWTAAANNVSGASSDLSARTVGGVCGNSPCSPMGREPQRPPTVSSRSRNTLVPCATSVQHKTSSAEEAAAARRAVAVASATAAAVVGRPRVELDGVSAHGREFCGCPERVSCDEKGVLGELSAFMARATSRATGKTSPRRLPVILVGFYRSAARFATEALLGKHGDGLMPFSLTADMVFRVVMAEQESCKNCCEEEDVSEEDLLARSLVRVGTRAGAVLLIRADGPSVEKLVSAVRALDGNVPIIIASSTSPSPGPIHSLASSSSCMGAPASAVGPPGEMTAALPYNGATCVLTAPLGPRDALAIRALAISHSCGDCLECCRVGRPQGVVYPSLTAKCTTAGSDNRLETPRPPFSSLRRKPHGPPSLTLAGAQRPTALRIPAHQYVRNEYSDMPISPSSPDDSLSTEAACSIYDSGDSRYVHRARVNTRSPLPGETQDSLRIGCSVAVERKHRRPSAIDFARLRARVEGGTTSRTSRVEDAAIGMLFSRCGGHAFAADFSSIATLCGLPVCVGQALHTAALAWHEVWSGDKGLSPARSPASVMDIKPCGRGECDVNEGRSGARSESSGSSLLPTLQGLRSTGMRDLATLVGKMDDRTSGSESVSYEMFKSFWTAQLCNRDCETRLYNVLRIAYKSEAAVPVRSVRDLAAALVSTRASDMDPCQLRSMASALLCYEMKGVSWNWMGRHEIRQARLCGCLLAAESGMYNGVASHLRADRMADIRMAFAAASGRRVGGGRTLALKDVIWLNSERGLLTPRAVEAVFERNVGKSGMGIAEFAPMWLAATNPDTAAACEYLFGLLDVDSDGYVGAVDAAHFYCDKRRVLKQEGYIATDFEHIWRGMLDAVGNGCMPSRMRGDPQLSLIDLRRLKARDWSAMFQSLLFLDDELAMVDLR